jgi:hypothetical protein
LAGCGAGVLEAGSMSRREWAGLAIMTTGLVNLIVGDWKGAGKMQWDAVAAMGQVVEAIFVAIGGLLIIKQLRGLKTEETHKKWEALRWAVSEVSVEDIALLHRVVKRGVDEGQRDERERFYQAIREIRDSLEIVSLAIDAGYVDQELFLKTRSERLARLQRTRPETLRDDRVWKDYNKAIASNPPVKALLDEAYKLQRPDGGASGGED